jgi:hypothetical protein
MKHHLSDLRGASRLAIDATKGLTELVEAMHQSIVRIPGASGAPTSGRTRGIAGLVYRTIRGATGLVGGGIDAVLARLAPMFDEATPSPGREAVLAALNGVLGDYLAATGNPLAISMHLRRNGRPLELARHKRKPARGELPVTDNAATQCSLWRRERPRPISPSISNPSTPGSGTGFAPMSARAGRLAVPVKVSKKATTEFTLSPIGTESASRSNSAAFKLSGPSGPVTKNPVGDVEDSARVAQSETRQISTLFCAPTSNHTRSGPGLFTMPLLNPSVT